MPGTFTPYKNIIVVFNIIFIELFTVAFFSSEEGVMHTSNFDISKVLDSRVL